MDASNRIARELGQRVIELRRERGWTQQALADRMLIDPRDLRRIEAGDNVTLQTLIRLAVALGVEVGSLFEPPKTNVKRKAGRPPTE